jgi:type II secretory pathway component PulF
MVLLEPFLILFLGGMVAAIVFAIILPMLEMNNALRGNR